MPTLAPFINARIIPAEPTVVGALAVFPLISDVTPAVRYLSFAAAVQAGLTITELPGGASVNDLVVRNPLGTAALLYEGEEVLGAQQNRTFDVSVLVAAGSVLKVPVSCVEAGRWDGSRAAEAFTPAPQTANPQLRRMKSTQARGRIDAGLEGRADQSEVWREVAASAGRHGVQSDTGAMHDVFETRRDQLNAITGAVQVTPGQVGMLAAIGGRFVVLDQVSEPDAFAALHGPLLQGYALDALDVATAEPPSVEDAQDFIDLLLGSHTQQGPAVGLGEGLRFAFGGLAGTALTHDGELVTMTAFADEPRPENPAATGRITRPSRRRNR
jgi:hypothetical protein